MLFNFQIVLLPVFKIGKGTNRALLFTVAWTESCIMLSNFLTRVLGLTLISGGG